MFILGISKDKNKLLFDYSLVLFYHANIEEKQSFSSKLDCQKRFQVKPSWKSCI